MPVLCVGHCPECLYEWPDAVVVIGGDARCLRIYAGNAERGYGGILKHLQLPFIVSDTEEYCESFAECFRPRRNRTEVSAIEILAVITFFIQP